MRATATATEAMIAAAAAVAVVVAAYPSQVGDRGKPHAVKLLVHFVADPRDGTERQLSHECLSSGREQHRLVIRFVQPAHQFRQHLLGQNHLTN